MEQVSSEKVAAKPAAQTVVSSREIARFVSMAAQVSEVSRLPLAERMQLQGSVQQPYQAY